MDPDERASTRLMHETDAEIRRQLVAGPLRDELDFDAPARDLQEHFERAAAAHPLNRMLYVYVKTYLSDELLRASDAMSMLHSLELRTPFLDYRLVERAMQMPAAHKMRGREGKQVMRDIARQVLPTHPLQGKRGFSLPVSTWVRGDLKERVREVLSRAAVAERGVFDPDAVDRVVKLCMAGNDRLVPPVMMLFCFETWARRWLDDPAAVSEHASVPVAFATEPAAPAPQLSVVIVNWNTRQRLYDCLASLREHMAAVDHEVIVVDNASSDGSPDMVAQEFPHVRLVRNSDNVGFGRANNQAMRIARGEWFLLLNSDTELFDDSVAGLVEHVRSENNLGVAHCRLLFGDGRQQHSTYAFPTLKTALIEDLGFYKLLPRHRAGELLLSGYWDYDEERDVDWVAGAFMLMPREVFEATGGFDERLFMYGEDLEWCQRIRDHGWRIRFYPQAALTHFDHSSSEIRWGDERIAICLQRQRDIYAERSGPTRAKALVALHVLGAVMRTSYYSVRSVVGPRASAYQVMKRSSSQALSALLPLLVRR
jgi:GT2 family glycosyltransferase